MESTVTRPARTRFKPLAGIPQRIFPRGPISLIEPRLEIGLGALRQEHLPRGFKIGAGLLEGLVSVRQSWAFRPVRMVRKRVAMPGQSAPGIGRQIVLCYGWDGQSHCRSRVLIRPSRIVYGPDTPTVFPRRNHPERSSTCSLLYIRRERNPRSSSFGIGRKGVWRGASFCESGGVASQICQGNHKPSARCRPD